MTTETIYKIALWYMPIYGILLLIPSILLFRKWFIAITMLIFDKLNLQWESQIEKPRIYFAGFGYLFIWSSWKISKLTFYDYWLCTPLSLLLSLFGLFLLYFILTKSFENKFITYAKEKLSVFGCKAIISVKSHNVKAIFNDLNNNYFESEVNVFVDLIVLNKLQGEQKIEWNDTVVNLIRFLFVLFNIQSNNSANLNHDNIRKLIEHYFQKYSEEIILTNTGSEISNVKKESDLNKEIFLEYKKQLLYLLEKNRKDNKLINNSKF